eukprot:3451670-Pyramimonas_sp.AAC.1
MPSHSGPDMSDPLPIPRSLARRHQSPATANRSRQSARDLGVPTAKNAYVAWCRIPRRVVIGPSPNQCSCERL